MKPNRVPDSAITRSATAHSPIPPPSAAPWTRAMTGTGHVSIASNMSAIAIASCSLPSTSSAIAARIQAMSAPAQNDGPSPARTTARSSVGPFAREPRERRPQLGDEGGVERVVDLGPVERHPRDDAARARRARLAGCVTLQSSASLGRVADADLVAETDAARVLHLAVHAEVDVLAVAQSRGRR